MKNFKKFGRLFLYRCASLFIFSVFILAIIEVLLSVIGAGYPVDFFIKSDRQGYLITNARFTWRFMPSIRATQPLPYFFSENKNTNAIRIFVLGESAAQGTPAPAFSFSRILQVMLENNIPDKNIEIINTATRGINSHAIRCIAQDCSKLQPDLFIIYMGNNEMCGKYSPSPGRFNITPHINLIRTIIALQQFKIVQIASSIIDSLRPDSAVAQDMNYFRKFRLAPDAIQRRYVYENFRKNLIDICNLGLKNNAKILLCTVGANLKDCPPLGSLHRSDLTEDELQTWEREFSMGIQFENSGNISNAIAHYYNAIKIDALHAELNYRIARCLLSSGDATNARQYYINARDYDALQFRTDSQINQIIRNLPFELNNTNIFLADIEKSLSDPNISEYGIAGAQAFSDHVHLTFDGDYFIAKTLFQKIINIPDFSHYINATDPPSKAQCAEALAYSAWDQINIFAAVIRACSRPPFLDQVDHDKKQKEAEALLDRRLKLFQKENFFKQCNFLYQQALSKKPDDWQIRFNYGSLLEDFQLYNDAIVQYSEAVKLMPYYPNLKIILSKALYDSGNQKQAVMILKDLVSSAPYFKPAKDALKIITSKNKSIATVRNLDNLN